MSTVIEFGAFSLDVSRRTLTQNGELIPLSSRLLDVLCCLANAEGHHVGKRELMDAIWPRTEIDENHLHVLISILRRTLGTAAREYLVTVPGYGYRLIAASRAVPIDPLMRAQPTVAVLPLRNLAAKALLEPICFGLMEDLAGALCRTRWLSTVLLDATQSEVERACLAGATYLVSGSLRRSSRTTRVSFRLVEAASGTLTWATGCDLAFDADFAQWDEIIKKISPAIETAILDAEQRRLLGKKSESPRIWEMFARASWHFTRATFEDNEIAKGLLERAIQLDPNFSSAHQWLAYTQMQYGNQFRTCSIARACGLAEPAAFKALDTDCQDAGSYSSLGFVAKVGGDPRRGLACAEQALALNPNEGDALRLKGSCQIALGLHQEGALALEYSMRIRPQDPQNWRSFEHLASSAHIQGDYEAVVAYGNEARRLNQNQTTSYPWLISALARLGRVAEARSLIAKVRLKKDPRPFDSFTPYRPLYLAEEHHDRVLEGMRMSGWRQ